MFRLTDDRAILVLKVICGLLLLQVVAMLVISGNSPITYKHEFRQTQTALTAYYFVKDGFRLAYETPVLGAPWSIPFEFPIYQAMAAELSRTGIGLEYAGRIVSCVFFVACLWPIHSLSRDLKLGAWWKWSLTALFLASPTYIFWSRSFMIETTALFFAMAHLSCYVAFLRRGTLGFVFLAAAFGILAGLAKVTTLPAFSVMAGLYFLWHVISRHLATRSLDRIWPTVIGALILVIPYPIALAWVHFTDTVKLLNPAGQLLTSYNISSFNYGSLEMRLSERFWRGVFLRRMLPDILGAAANVGLLLFLLSQIIPGINARMRRDRGVLFAVSVLGFFLPLMIFTNLHFIHNYYQVANSVFLLSAISLIGLSLFEAGRRWYALLLTGLIVLSQNWHYYDKYFPGVWHVYAGDGHDIAMAARELTPENSGLIVFGLDWNSVVPFYSQRRAFELANWIPDDLGVSLLKNPVATLGGLPLGGVVSCAHKGFKPTEPMLQLIAGRKELARRGVCVLYEGDS